MTNKAIFPENIVADGADYTIINNTSVRKGTVAAFIANIDILQNPTSSAEGKDNALAAMKKLAPNLVAIGLHHHVQFKNIQAEEIIQQAIKEA
ncbi:MULTISPECIES: hypothetical protein [Legionella]|uniref:Uncharacterized protein n=1 Tax=Legionella drozanskii LLAP-1 TaxID=1212489 RepID=A0A0W0SQA3_9GAMM|nr:MULTISPECIES: hypothetical protein [Legionella]KTC85586.1 hypothetical protein Ldro_1911 [Legionella drozanskii LLAP-1]PJE15815.1 MAG: hypothetical protein CK430_03930 [Legionella sp.]